MQPKPTQPEADIISCDICLTEIPCDLACCEEAVEYVQYFCGYNCFAQWQQLARLADARTMVRR